VPTVQEKQTKSERIIVCHLRYCR